MAKAYAPEGSRAFQIPIDSPNAGAVLRAYLSPTNGIRQLRTAVPNFQAYERFLAWTAGGTVDVDTSRARVATLPDTALPSIADTLRGAYLSRGLDPDGVEARRIEAQRRIAQAAREVERIHEAARALDAVLRPGQRGGGTADGRVRATT